MSAPLAEQIDQVLASQDHALRPHSMLGEYLLLEKLGEGAFGDVWRGEHSSNGRVAALKVFVPARFSQSEQRAAADRFTEGVTAMQKLHAEARVIDLYEGPRVDGNHLWFAMRYYPHKDLKRWIQQHPDTPYETRIKIVEDVLSALDTAHSMGIVHRDVRPGNILIEDAGVIRAVLADFDIAYFEDFLRQREKTATFLGWPRYLPADIFGATGDEIPAKLRRYGNDLYALSVVALDLLAGSEVSIPEKPTSVSLRALLPIKKPLAPYGLPPSVIRRLASFFGLALAGRAPPFASAAAFRLAWVSAVTSTRSMMPLLAVPMAFVVAGLTFADWAMDQYSGTFFLRVISGLVPGIFSAGVLLSGLRMAHSFVAGAIPPWKQRLARSLSEHPVGFWVVGATFFLGAVGTTYATLPRDRMREARIRDAQACLGVDSTGRVTQWFISSERSTVNISSIASLECPEASQLTLTPRSLLTPLPLVRRVARPHGRIVASQVAPTEFSADVLGKGATFHLIGVRRFSEENVRDPDWSSKPIEIGIQLPARDSPLFVIAVRDKLDVGATQLAQGWLRIDPTKHPPDDYRDIERQAQDELLGNWKELDRQQRRAALLKACPARCCEGTPCEEQPSCILRWQCAFCRDGTEAVRWRIRLDRVSVEHPVEWTNVKVCLSVGDAFALNCVLGKDSGTPLAFFDGTYNSKKMSNAYLLVLGTNQNGIEERMSHRTLSLKINPSSLCGPWGIDDFVVRNGGVQTVRLSMHGPLAP